MRDTARAMPEENVEIIRAAYQAVSRGDFAATDELLHPDFEWTTDARVPNAGTYRGRDEVRRFWTDQRAPFDEWIAEPERFIECGKDQVLALVKVCAKPKGSSVPIEIQIAHLWTMEAGRGVRAQAFAERDAALEAAGLSE